MCSCLASCDISEYFQFDFEVSTKEQEESTATAATDATDTSNDIVLDTTAELESFTEIESTTETSLDEYLEALEELNKQIFQQLYAMEESNYLLGLSIQLSDLNSELSEVRKLASEAYGQYQRELQALPEKMASMGFGKGDGPYKRAEQKLEDEYKETSAIYSKQIDAIEDDIAVLTKEINKPTVNNILALLAQHNKMTYEEAVTKYNKYIKTK